MKTALVYKGNGPEAARTVLRLQETGYRVYTEPAGGMSEEDWKRLEGEALDLLVLCPDTEYEGADGAVGTGRDYEGLSAFVSDRIYEIHEAMQRCIPMLEKGEGRRIVLLTKAYSSINWCKDKEGFAKHMILTGINMQAKLLFNRLRPRGFTMRCYAAGMPENREEGIGPEDYMGLDFCYEAEEPAVHSDENRLVMRDRFFREIPW